MFLRNETADWGQTYNYAIGLAQKSGSEFVGAFIWWKFFKLFCRFKWRFSYK